MKCRKVRKLAESYLLGDLEGDIKELVEEHLKKCLECSQFYRREKAFLSLLKKGMGSGSRQTRSLLVNWSLVFSSAKKKSQLRLWPSLALIFLLILGIFLLISPGSLGLISKMHPSSEEESRVSVMSSDVWYPHNPPTAEGLNYRIGFY
ncbi:MAG: zf-HC2 domain-containing protein [bacterium]